MTVTKLIKYLQTVERLFGDIQILNDTNHSALENFYFGLKPRVLRLRNRKTKEENTYLILKLVGTNAEYFTRIDKRTISRRPDAP